MFAKELAFYSNNRQNDCVPKIENVIDPSVTWRKMVVPQLKL